MLLSPLSILEGGVCGARNRLSLIYTQGGKNMRLAAILVITAVLAGCAPIPEDPNAPFSVVRTYPLGPGQFMVTCVDSPSYCARQATADCPNGFDVVSNTNNPADYGRTMLIVRCHA